PANRTRPESEPNWPLSCAIKVVLPAPLGPMMACSSPRGTSSVMASLATMPPNRFDNPSICSSGSATFEPRVETWQQDVDAAAREQHDQQQQGPEDDLPIFGDAREYLFEQQQR